MTLLKRTTQIFLPHSKQIVLSHFLHGYFIFRSSLGRQNAQVFHFSKQIFLLLRLFIIYLEDSSDAQHQFLTNEERVSLHSMWDDTRDFANLFISQYCNSCGIFIRLIQNVSIDTSCNIYHCKKIYNNHGPSLCSARSGIVSTHLVHVVDSAFSFVVVGYHLRLTVSICIFSMMHRWW